MDAGLTYIRDHQELVDVSKRIYTVFEISSLSNGGTAWVCQLLISMHNKEHVKDLAFISWAGAQRENNDSGGRVTKSTLELKCQVETNCYTCGTTRTATCITTLSIMSRNTVRMCPRVAGMAKFAAIRWRCSHLEASP